MVNIRGYILRDPKQEIGTSESFIKRNGMVPERLSITNLYFAKK